MPDTAPIFTNDARNEHPIHELLRQRRSPRAYDGRPVAREQLHSILEAGRWAASANNEQPWAFIVAEQSNAAEFTTMLGCLKPNNQLWAKNAGALVLLVARRNYLKDDRPNRTAAYDLGQAAANMALQATALGLQAHQMGGVEFEQAKSVYQPPEGFEIFTGMAFGHPGDPATLPDALRERETTPRVRRPMAEFVFAGGWGRKAFP